MLLIYIWIHILGLSIVVLLVMISYVNRKRCCCFAVSNPRQQPLRVNPRPTISNPIYTGPQTVDFNQSQATVQSVLDEQEREWHDQGGTLDDDDEWEEEPTELVTLDAVQNPERGNERLTTEYATTEV